MTASKLRLPLPDIPRPPPPKQNREGVWGASPPGRSTGSAACQFEMAAPEDPMKTYVWLHFGRGFYIF